MKEVERRTINVTGTPTWCRLAYRVRQGTGTARVRLGNVPGASRVRQGRQHLTGTDLEKLSQRSREKDDKRHGYANLVPSRIPGSAGDGYGTGTAGKRPRRVSCKAGKAILDGDGSG
ncbi:hypothetical protein DY000_02042022 [Brassica cretica]|uniref:Uncharacterized protein n=1 Tax=Brassica cretica TaxID=69181 RepID=A0ABQ7B9W4_BRACR|nr:hypothetical protein DY000_02042022 [Brassica cretica]